MIALSRLVEAKKKEKVLLQRVRQELATLRENIKERDSKIATLKNYLQNGIGSGVGVENKQQRSANSLSKSILGGNCAVKSINIHARKHSLNNMKHSPSASSYKKI